MTAELRDRRLVSFAQRDGRRLPSHLQRAWDEHHGTVLIDIPRDVDRTSVAPGFRLDARREFGRVAPLVVEIGSGGGDAVAHAAQARPEADFLAVEVYRPGVAQTVAKVGRHGLTNVRIVEADAIDVLTTMLLPSSVEQVWTFFPDPWPKTRHRKRRLVTAAFAELVASRLVHGGAWRLATDWEVYARRMLAVAAGCDQLVNPYARRRAVEAGPQSGVAERQALVRGDGLAPRFEGRPLTRFERKAVEAGRTVFDLTLDRVSEVAT